MPTYTYKREDGSFFDFEQKITDAPLTECPTTGQPVKRVITGGAGLVFKGSGFYLTDYVKPGSNASNGEKKEDAKPTSDKGKSPAADSKETATASKNNKSDKSDKSGE